jgi:hypothetical protein
MKPMKLDTKMTPNQWGGTLSTQSSSVPTISQKLPPKLKNPTMAKALPILMTKGHHTPMVKVLHPLLSTVN